MSYFVGFAVTLDVTTADASGAAFAPAVLEAYVRPPGDNGNQISVYSGGNSAWTNSATGVYTFAFTPNLVGTWRVTLVMNDATAPGKATVSVRVEPLAPV